MKIAVVHTLPSGGALRVAREHARRLGARHEVKVFSLSGAEGGGDLDPSNPSSTVEYVPSEALGWPLGMLDPLRQLVELARLDGAGKALAGRVNAWGPEVVLAHPCRYTQAPLVMRHLEDPVVYVLFEPPRMLHESHLFAPGAPDPSPPTWRQWRNSWMDRPVTAFRRHLDWSCSRRARAIVAQSDFVAEWILRLYGRWSTRVDWGIDPVTFHPDGPAEPSDPDRGYVLSVGAMSWVKGFWFLVDALALVAEKVRPALWIASDRGHPGEVAHLRARAEKTGVETRFFGTIDDEALARLYRGARATVYAPVLEPLGLVPLESMACGTPVVAVREGGVRETVTGEIGGLCVERNPALFAAALELILFNEGMRARLRETGIEHVRSTRTWESSMNQLERLLVASARLPRDRIL